MRAAASAASHPAWPAPITMTLKSCSLSIYLIIITFMNMPVFEHSVSSLRALIQNEEMSLSKVASLLKYDPGLYFSLLNYINAVSTRGETTSITQAVSLIGAEGL